MKRARAVGVTSREVDDRALGLRDDLVRDTRTSPGSRPPARSAAAASSAARSSPGRDLRDPVERDEPAAPSSPPHAAERVARVDGGARAASRRAPRRARRGPRACRRRASARRSRRSRTVAPASCARRSWRARLPSPKLGSITSGGVSSSALVPVPWRSGTITTSGPSDEHRGRARRSPPRWTAGASPASSRTWKAPSPSAQSIPRAAASLWPSVGSSAITWAP